jgi:hypothetical protein
MWLAQQLKSKMGNITIYVLKNAVENVYCNFNNLGLFIFWNIQSNIDADIGYVCLRIAGYLICKATSSHTL